MSTLNVFKRMNFFTGFFTTATDWNEGQEYHQKKRRLHNRGMHTPGIVTNINTAEEPLYVKKVEGTSGTVTVNPGVAIDGLGNEICLAVAKDLAIDLSSGLPKTVYIALKYGETLTDKVDNPQYPDYSGFTRYTEIPIVQVTTDAPDNQTAMELARIRLSADATEISAPGDPAHPVDNEIDCTHVLTAGAVSDAGVPLSVEDLTRFIARLPDSRADFAVLNALFPVPSLADLRQVLFMLDMILRSRCVRSDDFASVLYPLVQLELAIVDELADAYPAMVEVPIAQYAAFKSAVESFESGVNSNFDADNLFTLFEIASEAARNLGEIELTPPVADPGLPVSAPVSATGTEATVELDASNSADQSDRRIVKYRWRRH